FGTLAERRAYAWSHIGIAGIVARRDLRAMTASCEPLFGARAEFVAYQLAQGSENDTITADAELARIARSGSRADGLHAFLDVYGSRSTGWSIDHEVLRERPDLLDAQLR